MEISTIVFDFGNVLIGWDPRGVYRETLKTDEAIAEFFDEVDFPSWNLEQDRGGRTWSEAVEELSSRFPHRRELIQAFDERWERSITGPIDGTVAIARRLREAGFQMVGLTNWSSEKFRQTRRRYDIFEIFDEIVVSGDVGLIKPDPAIFEYLLNRIGRTAGQCLFIDDSRANIDAAAALGFQTIHFRSPEQLEEELGMRLPSSS